jgi:hypothetical protein
MKQFEQNNIKQAISDSWHIMQVSKRYARLAIKFYLAHAYFAEGQKTNQSQIILM